MKSLHNSAIGDFTRGGQVTINFLRMIWQVISKFGLVAVMVYSLITFGLWYGQSKPYERYLAGRFVAAQLGVWLGNGNRVTPLDDMAGNPVNVTLNQMVDNTVLQHNAWRLAHLWLRSMLHSAFAALVVLLGLFSWLYSFGRSQRNETHLRGGMLVEADELAKIVRKRGLAGQLRFAGIPLLAGSETQHINITGSPGTGKTTGIYELLAQIRRRGDRVICFSPSGDFLSWFYRDGKDTILNPFDGRSPTWDLWGECDQPYHYQMIAGAMIPVPEQGEKIWAEAAQTLVATLLRKHHERGNPRIDELMKVLTQLPMEQIYEFLKDTEVAAYLDPKNDRMGASIRSTAAIALRSMGYIPLGRDPFTMKNWVEGADDGRWVFLTARADQQEASKPILSTMIEVAVSRILSLPESRTRRIWLVIDELPTLQKLPSLRLFLEQARKFGGCGLIGFQQFSQLQSVYGKEMALTLTGMCSTWICYRQNDPETAKIVSEKFGKVEVEENQHGLSMGPNDMRDGVTMNTQRKERDVILASEVMAMKDLTGLVKLSGDLPGGRFALKRGKIPEIASPFVLPVRDPLQDVLDMSLKDIIPLGGDDDPVESLSAPAEPPAEVHEDAGEAAPVESVAPPPPADPQGSFDSFATGFGGVKR